MLLGQQNFQMLKRLSKKLFNKGAHGLKSATKTIQKKADRDLKQAKENVQKSKKIVKAAHKTL